MTDQPEGRETGRTPGPWIVYDQGKDDGSWYGCHIRSTTDDKADWIAQEIHNRADARLIVQAVNERDSLLEALRGLIEAGRSVASFRDPDSLRDQEADYKLRASADIAWAQFRAALSRAEQEVKA